MCTLYQTKKTFSQIQSIYREQNGCDFKSEISFQIENIVGIVENPVNRHFPHFPQCFQKALFSRSFKMGFYRNELIYQTM